MKKLDLPDIKQSEIYDALDSLQYKDILLEKSLNYCTYLIDLKPLLDFEEKQMGTDKDYKPHLNKMYSSRFSNKSYRNVYCFYKKIRASSTNCPYCNFPTRHARQVDHFFPKSVFPSLSLTATNLVPICMDCNNSKREYYSLENSRMLIHPYYDSFVNDAFSFIHCDIIEKEPIGFIFSIKKLESMTDTIYTRLKTHFELLELNKLYSSDFESDFDAESYYLQDLYREQGTEEVRKYLKRKISSLKKSTLKPWIYVAYYALHESDWFFDFYLKKIC